MERQSASRTRPGRLLRLALCLAMLQLGIGLAAQTPIQYFSDDVGRLIAVVDQTGNAAIYTYDAVGNILSITRQSASAIRLFTFSPRSGLPGTVVTIQGLGFSATPAQNTVTFNGTPATVTAASQTQLTVSVPAGATSGLISITSPSGTATSASGFAVGGGASPPVVTSFTPQIGRPGVAVAIAGANFQAEPTLNRPRFNVRLSQVQSVTATSLTTPVPQGATSGPMYVTTPFGEARSTADFFVPPGSYLETDVSVTGRLTAGQAFPVSLSTANKIGLLVFDPLSGPRVTLRMTGVTISSTAVSIVRPGGQTLASEPFVGTAGQFMEAPLPNDSGTYSVLIDPISNYTGSMTLSLGFPIDVNTPIVAGGPPVTVSLSVLGQNALLPFTGTSAQRVSLRLSSVSLSQGNVSITRPDGLTLLAPTTVTAAGAFIEPLTLPMAGTYTIFLDPPGTTTGNATFTLYSVPADVTSPITPGGSPVTVSLGTPGQNAYLAFSGTAGQRVSLDTSASTIVQSYLSIRKPDGSALVSPTWTTGATSFLDTVTLPTTGTYTVVVDPFQANTGSMTLTLRDVPADVTGSITPGGSPVTVNLGIPGQNAYLSFSGAAGQRVSLKTSASTITQSYLSIRKPDGSALASPTWTTGATSFIETVTLPTAGTYTVVVDPYLAGTGSMTLTLYDVPADVAASLVPGGSPTTVTVSVPGQNAVVAFAGTAGQRVSLRTSASTIVQSYLSIRKPDGSALVSPTFTTGTNSFIDTVALPATGTYTVAVDPYLANTGSMTLTLYDVPADASGTLSVGGGAVALTLSTPGQNGVLTFAGTSGQAITVRVTSNNAGLTTVSLINPSGGTVTSSSGSSTFNLTGQTLSATGTYQVKVNPFDVNAGTVAISVTTP